MSGKVGWRDIEHGLGAGHTLGVHAVRRSRTGEQDGAGELGVGIELQAVFDHMTGTLGGRAAVDHGAAVGQTAVVALHLFFGDEVNGGVILVKIVGHGLDRVLDRRLVRAVLGDDKALAGMLLAGGQLGILSVSDGGQRRFDRNGVLARVLDAGDTADSVGVTLADALAPERIRLAAGQDRVGVDAVEREHARIPSGGDDADLARFFGGGVNVGEMLGDARVGVEAVDHVVQRGKLRGHFGQVGRGTAADHQHVDRLLTRFKLRDGAHGHAGRVDGQAPGSAAGVNGDQLRIGIHFNGCLNASAEIAVA